MLFEGSSDKDARKIGSLMTDRPLSKVAQIMPGEACLRDVFSYNVSYADNRFDESNRLCPHRAALFSALALGFCPANPRNDSPHSRESTEALAVKREGIRDRVALRSSFTREIRRSIPRAQDKFY